MSVHSVNKYQSESRESFKRKIQSEKKKKKKKRNLKPLKEYITEKNKLIY